MNFVIKKSLDKIISTLAISSFLFFGGNAIKNVAETRQNIQQNLEYKITSSDIKQLNNLNSLLEKPTENLSILNTIGGAPFLGLHLNFHAYSLINIGLSEQDKTKSIQSLDKVINIYISDEIKNKILTDNIENKKLENLKFNELPNVKENLYYYANLNLMLNGYELISNDKKYSNLTKILSMEISKEIVKSNGKNLNSFPGLSWSADMPVALASIYINDYLNNTNLSKKPIRLWKEWIKTNALDGNGNLYTTLDSTTNMPIDESKGSNFAYSIIFTSIFDKEFSKELYSNFKKNFYKPIFGIELAKEWQDGRNETDGDSGPVLFGIGSVASAFAIGASKVNYDDGIFSNLSLIAELSTLPYELFDKKDYLLNVSLGESVLLYCRTLRPWIK